jgi:hypothetical protein
MRDGVMRPETERFEFGGGTRLVLGAGVIAGFLQAEAVEGQQCSVARLVLRPEWQRPCRAIPDPMETPQESVGQCRALMRHQVERIAHQVAVQRCDGSGPGALAQMRQGGEMSLLALVQGQRPGDLNQSFGLDPQARVIRQREHPSFPEMRHGAIGGGLTCCVKQADGVAVHEVKRPYCLIVRGDGRGCRAGQVMSLGVLGHVWLPTFDWPYRRGFQPFGEA